MQVPVKVIKVTYYPAKTPFKRSPHTGDANSGTSKRPLPSLAPIFDQGLIRFDGSRITEM